MAITNAFNKAITEGNIRQIRIMLKDSLLVDPTFERYNEMEKLASTVPGIYDEHDGRPFKSQEQLKLTSPSHYIFQM